MIIQFNDYKDKVLGCLYGKNIGGTLGAPFECYRGVHDVNFYTQDTSKPIPNDDVDLQLVWLRAVEMEGKNSTRRCLPNTGAHIFRRVSPSTARAKIISAWAFGPSFGAFEKPQPRQQRGVDPYGNMGMSCGGASRRGGAFRPGRRHGRSQRRGRVFRGVSRGDAVRGVR